MLLISIPIYLKNQKKTK